ncbi:MAG: FlgO family outer membrane protein [Bacteroidia bacterium]|nr:FlgO family outer membrane protein [Bacteroidia bacterium]
MPSLIPCFEYDIFISYRQKDNKYVGCVTDFVSNLKKELEATFKDEVSVYFDINPHDGLLETHDVDASLKDKLKCAIFIPVISRTYCDPKSFAWQNELKAFIEQVTNDQFGLKVKLPNGNVTSRVLPVRIHELDPEDLSLCESVTGGYLRGVEFIYKEPGVNRPLKTDDDEKNNLNKTKYRNQINKTANAIKEIISGLKTYQSAATKDDHLSRKAKSEPGNLGSRLVQIRKGLVSLRLKNRIILVLSALLVIAGAFIVYKIIEGSVFTGKLKSNAKSIAVMAFHNYSDDSNQENVSDGLTSEIITHLYKIRSFDKVVSLGSVLPYKGTDKKIRQIADELKVNYILEGTYRKISDQVRVTAQLIDPEDENILWQNEYDKPYKQLIAIQADIALQIANQVKAFITNSEKQNITKSPTDNQEAYELIQKGLYIWNTRSFKSIDQMLDLTAEAMKLDPNYADAYAFAGLLTLLKVSQYGGSKVESVVWDATSYLEKALKLDPDNTTAHLGMAWFNDWIRWDFPQAEKEFLKVLELEPNNPIYPELYVEFLLKMNRPEEALNYQFTSEQSYRLIQAKILSGRRRGIQKDFKEYLKSQGSKGLKYAGDCFLWMHEYDSARFYLESALNVKDPQFMIPRFQAYLALAYSKTNQNDQAQKIIGKLAAMSKVTTAGSPDYFTGWYYSGIGQIDSAFIWLEKAFRNRSFQLGWLKTDPVFNSLKSDGRYRDLYERTGHKAYDDYIAGRNK